MKKKGSFFDVNLRADDQAALLLLPEREPAAQDRDSKKKYVQDEMLLPGEEFNDASA